ncbi:MAG: hypothetical protein KatS3mg097_626 [Candidatus Parcubacteria bacterium]|nr:MAG: hypothetical protein KatS3mg097_626 [Candidatus Parcubacteria bacterium]
MKKYYGVFFLIFAVVSLNFLLNYRLIADLILISIIDPDNYDVLGFILDDDNLIYLVFIVFSFSVVDFIFAKNYFSKLFIKTTFRQQDSFLGNLYIRSPPF